MPTQKETPRRSSSSTHSVSPVLAFLLPGRTDLGKIAVSLLFFS